jgi:predicted DNA-binding WGR domain protein
MRRYEISGEKFWQYEVTGSEVLQEWGKIGGSGKSRSHKSYASEDVAQKEVDKLIKKKTAEGFVEIGTATTPTPSPSPAPAPTVATPTIAARIVWTEAARNMVVAPKELEGNEGSWLVTIREHYEQPNWEKIPLKVRLQRGLAKATLPEARKWAERILASYAVGKAPSEADVEGDAAALSDWAPPAELGAFWTSRFGIVHVAKVLGASLGVAAREEGRGDDSFVTYDRTKTESIHHGSWQFQLAGRIRLALPNASAKDQAEIRAELDVLWRSGSLPYRILAAYASNDRAWEAEVATEFLGAKKELQNYDMPNCVFAFLRDPALVMKVAKKFPSTVPPYVLLNEMGLDAEPAVIAYHDKDANNSWATEALALIESLPAARQMAESLAKKRAADVAKAYFERRPDLAMAVLEPLVKHAQLGPFVKPMLDALARKHPELAGNLAPKKPQAKVSQHVPSALAMPPQLKKSVTLPEWTKGMPQVLLPDGTALPDSAIQNLLLALHESTIEKPHSMVVSAKKECDPRSLGEFAWALFEAWLAASGSSKEGWAFTATGHLGGDDEARKLAPLIRAWPGESQHARAVTGLSVLGAIGTDVSLMHLHGIAQKVKFKGLQEKARLKMDEMAKARGLTADELGDRLVPDLGLDDNGSLELDFGSRKFTVGFDEELKPFVRDGSGARIAELPKPNKSDDAAKGAEASERWKTLKKDAKAIASLQITRLELAMCAMRRWKAEDFQTLIVDHPLVVHLARRLVWGIFEGGKLGATFRVEDRNLVSADEEAVKLPKGAMIGLCHRMEMDEKLLGAWGDHLGRYEMLQPFDQIGRELYTIDAKEKKSNTLERTKGLSVKTGKVLGLEMRGWRKGPPQDAGWVWEMNKHIGELELSLPLGGGLCMGWSEGTPSDQELGAVSISKRDGSKATFDMLPPVIFSEIVRELLHLEA